MRRAVLAGLVLAVLPAAGPAQNGPYLAVVTDPEVKLRAGPSDQYPETGTLPRGTRVVVDHDESNGWVAIEAPQGQVSWISALFIEGFDPGRATPQRVYVATDADVTLSPGRSDQQEPLQSIRRVKVPNGTILMATGPKARFADKWWYPVAPPAGDFRYLPKTAVQFDKAVNAAFAVRENLPPATPAGGIPPAAGT